jgi:hypothetical protein
MQKVIGGIIMAVGILVAGLTGLCTLMMFLEAPLTRSDFNFEGIMIVAIFAGIPLAIGVGMIFLGRYLIRNAG